jgi:Gas vesicle synthesis protein GvpL/GvpF
MRFPAVVEEEGIVEELLAPHHDQFVEALGELEGRVQFTLKGRYDQDVVLREVLEEDPEIRQLQEEIRDLPEDATYQQRIRLGELVVRALEERRMDDEPQLLERLQPYAVSIVAHDPAQPDEVINAAFLVERERQQEFEDAVEELGADLHPSVRLRLMGPLAPYDFVAEG